MKVKYMAIFFIFLVSFHHVMSAVSQVPSAKQELLTGLERGPREKRAVTQCSVSPQVAPIIDQAIDNCRKRISNSYELHDHTTSEIRMHQGISEGWQNVARSSPVVGTCSDRETLHLFVEVNYLSVTIHYTLTLLDKLLGGILNGALSGLSSTLTSLLGNVTTLLLRILATDIRVFVQLQQKLVPGARCTVVSYKVTRITSIRVLNLDLSIVANLLEGILTPVLDLVLKLVLTGSIQQVFISEFSQISIPLNLVRFL